MGKIIKTILLFILVGVIWMVYSTSKNTRENKENSARKQENSLTDTPGQLSENTPKEEKEDRKEEKEPETVLQEEEIEDLQSSVQAYSDWSSSADQGESPFPPPFVEEVDGVAQRTMHMGVRQWEWFPEKITANYKEEVIIIMHNADVTHSISIPELDVKQEITEDGAVVRFMADKQGTFAFFCDTPCGKDHDKMKGEITVS